MKWIAALLLVLTGCAGGAGQRDRVAILIWNDTDQPVTGTVSAGIFSGNLTIGPHSCKDFWVLRSLMPNEITFKITSPFPPR